MTIPDFRIEGTFDSEICSLEEEFTGWIAICGSSKEIKSVEMQVVRS